jgi:hypothetical protein
MSLAVRGSSPHIWFITIPPERVAAMDEQLKWNIQEKLKS